MAGTLNASDLAEAISESFPGDVVVLLAGSPGEMDVHVGAVARLDALEAMAMALLGSTLKASLSTGVGDGEILAQRVRLQAAFDALKVDGQPMRLVSGGKPEAVN